MAKRIVIGVGPDALRAAGVLATADNEVGLLTEASTPAGRGLPSIPVGTGRLRVRPESRALVEQVLGPLAPFPDGGRAIAVGGKVHRLPLSPALVPTLLPAATLPAAARTWLTARVRNSTRQIVGSGSEERSYQDWVVRRMGQTAYDALYRSYGERRWGLPGDELSVSIARLHLGLPDSAEPLMVAGGEASAQASAEALVRRQGSVEVGVEVTGLVVSQGKVVAVRTAAGERPVDGPLWIARNPSVVVRWLGEAADSGMRVDGAALRSRQILQVVLEGDTSRLPSEIHVLDEGAPFFRVVRPPGTQNLAVFHALLEPGQSAPPARLVADRFVPSARQLGIGDFAPESVAVEALPEMQPLWGRVCHARIRRLLLRFRELGIVLVGRTGVFAPLDPAEEIAIAGLYRDERDPDQREAQRATTDPPVLQDDLGARITRFVER